MHTHLQEIATQSDSVKYAHLAYSDARDMTDETFDASCADTPHAKAIYTHLSEMGVAVDKLVIRDDHRAKSPYSDSVFVLESWNKRLTPDEFGTFMTAINRIEAASDKNRFGYDDDCLAIAHEYIETEIMTDRPDPVEAGKELAGAGGNATHPEDMATQAEADTEDAKIDMTGYDVMQIKQDLYAVSDPECRTYQIEMRHMGSDRHRVKPLAGDVDTMESEKIDELITAVIKSCPAFREGPTEHLSVQVGNESMQSAGGSDHESNTQQSGSDSDSDDDSGFDENGWNGNDEQQETLESWIETYAQVKPELDPECIEIDAGTYEGDNGFRIDTQPFSAGYHGGRGGEWEDKEGYEMHQDAFRDIMQGEDEIIYDGDEYLNFVPADAVSVVVGDG